MPHILPLEKIKDLEEVTKLCEKSDEPVFLTKDGAGAFAILDMESYEKLVKREEKKEDEEMDGVDLLLKLQKEMEE